MLLQWLTVAVVVVVVGGGGGAVVVVAVVVIIVAVAIEIGCCCFMNSYWLLAVASGCLLSVVALFSENMAPVCCRCCSC